VIWGIGSGRDWGSFGRACFSVNISKRLLSCTILQDGKLRRVRLSIVQFQRQRDWSNKSIDIVMSFWNCHSEIEVKINFWIVDNLAILYHGYCLSYQCSFFQSSYSGMHLLHQATALFIVVDPFCNTHNFTIHQETVSTLVKDTNPVSHNKTHLFGMFSNRTSDWAYLKKKRAEVSSGTWSPRIVFKAWLKIKVARRVFPIYMYSYTRSREAVL